MKHTRAAAVRRRRLATSLSAVTTIVVIVVVLLTQLGSPSHSHAHAGTSARKQNVPSTKGGSAVATVSETTSLRKAIAAYVSHRHGAVSAAVYDRVSGQLMVFNPKLRGRTASIVKVDILETLLHRTGGHLSPDQRATATHMIENSDNASATDLFDQDGGAAGLKAYNNLVGLKQTTPNSAWGLTTTSAVDQLTLVRELLTTSTLLTDSARKYQRTLMRHVESDQEWGISGGVPDNVAFGNKNGWLPVTEDHNRWAVNSIGWVRGDGKSYAIAVITQHNQTEGYGIHTIEHIASLSWTHMSVAPPPAS
jgi:Beta-lactamase enzyme family